MVLSVTVWLNVSNPLRKTSASLPLESRHAVLAWVLACTSSASSLSCYSKSQLDHERSNSQKTCVEKVRGGCASAHGPADLLRSAGWVLPRALKADERIQPCGSVFIFYTWWKLLLLTLQTFIYSNRAGRGRHGRKQQGKAVFCGAAPLQVLCELWLRHTCSHKILLVMLGLWASLSPRTVTCSWQKF